MLLRDSEVYRNRISEMIYRIITFIIVGGFTMSGIMKLSPVISPEIHSQMVKFRSSHRRCSTKKVLLIISQNLLENSCVGVSFLLKKRLRHRCFPVNIMKFLKTPFLQNTSGWLFLKILHLYYHVLVVKDNKISEHLFRERKPFSSEHLFRERKPKIKMASSYTW